VNSSYVELLKAGGVSLQAPNRLLSTYMAFQVYFKVFASFVFYETSKRLLLANLETSLAENVPFIGNFFSTTTRNLSNAHWARLAVK
jgi:hypothetical protein